MYKRQEQSFGYAGFGGLARELTDGEGVAVVYDGVGRDTFDESLGALRVRGEMVLFGGASGQVPPFDLQRLNAGGSLSITRPSLGHFMRTPEAVSYTHLDVYKRQPLVTRGSCLAPRRTPTLGTCRFL